MGLQRRTAVGKSGLLYMGKRVCVWNGHSYLPVGVRNTACRPPLCCLVNPGCGVTGQGCGGRHRAIRLGQSRFMGVSIGRVRAYAAIPRRAWEGRITTSAVQVNDLVNPACGKRPRAHLRWASPHARTSVPATRADGPLARMRHAL